MPKKIYLIRHGETDYNRQWRFQGWLDIHLNEQGHEQARATSEKLLVHPFDAIYSSDLARAKETAQYLAASHQLRLHLTKALREIDMGIFSGWSWKHEPDPVKQSLWEEFESARDAGDLFWNKHQGETMGQMTGRLARFFRRMEKLHADQSVALVTHGGTVNRILEYFELKRSAEGYRQIHNASVLVLVRTAARYKLVEL